MNFIRYIKESINRHESLNYDRMLLIYRVVLVVLILLILGVLTYVISYELTTNNYQVAPQQYKIVEIDKFDESSFLVTREPEYLLKDTNGKIAIFEVGEFEPFMTLDVYTSTLPYLDRQNLLDGIIVVGEDNLCRIIEDFDS